MSIVGYLLAIWATGACFVSLMMVFSIISIGVSVYLENIIIMYIVMSVPVVPVSVIFAPLTIFAIKIMEMERLILAYHFMIAGAIVSSMTLIIILVLDDGVKKISIFEFPSIAFIFSSAIGGWVYWLVAIPRTEEIASEMRKLRKRLQA